MAGHSAAAAPTRFAGIQVQTSSLGVQVPIVWGTGRCKCNLVDYLDFKSVAQKAASGKGGAVVTGYAYTATIILALCEGPIVKVTQVWVDGKNYASGSLGSGVANTGVGSAPAQVGLTLATGAVGQAPWSYLTSQHPGHAIGYSGLAIVYAEKYALDSGAGTPQHSFEVVSTTTVAGLPDANPEAVLTDFFTNSRYGLPNWGAGLLDAVSFGAYSTYCLAQNLLVSPVLDQGRQSSDFLSELMTATNSNLLWSEGLLKIVVYGDTPVAGNGATFTPNLTPIYALTDDHFIPKADGDDALGIDIEDQSDAYNIVQLEYLDRTNQYSTAIATANDAANISQYGRRKQDPTTVHVICDPKVAQLAAQLVLQRTLYIRKQYKFTLSWAFALLEPGDIVTLTHAAMGLVAYAVRLIQIDEDEDGLLEVTAEDLLAGVSHAPLYGIQTGQGTQLNRNTDPGGVEANLLVWSQDFTQSAWSAAALAIAAAAAVDPVYGAADAQKLTPSTGSGVHSIAQSVSGFADANYTFTVYLSADGYSRAALLLGDGGADTAEVSLDLAAGAVTATAATGAAAVMSAGITPAPLSGWWRAQITAQLPATAVAAALCVCNNAGAQSFAGDGVSAVLVFGAQLTQGVDARTYAATTSAASGPVIFNPPVALTPGGVATWAAVAGGPNWGGANVWVSYDGAEYELLGQTGPGGARFGQLTAALPLGLDPDTSDTLSVDLGASSGVLQGAAQAVADAAGTLCLVDEELISFETLANPAANVFALSGYIRRGALGTAIAAHAGGATFVRLDDAIFDFPYLAAQAGLQAYVKFQSFNLWGQGLTPLQNCVAYPCVPVPAGARSPEPGAWTAIGTELSNAGQSIPAIVVTGASDNPSATLIEFDYRVTGAAVWTSAGTGGPATTRKEIVSVQSGQSYDVSVVYLVGGIASARQVIATGITVGQVGTGAAGGGSGVGPGVTIADISSGSGAVAMPAGAYGHVDIVLTGFPGAGNGQFSGGGGKGIGTVVDQGGGGGMSVVVLGWPVTPGSTSISYALASAVGANSTATAAGLSLTASSGANASAAAPGAGGSTSGITKTAAGATSVTSHAGHSGGLADVWDGGGAADLAGVYVDNVRDASAGALPGQAGSGAVAAFGGPLPGGGANLLIIARA